MLFIVYILQYISYIYYITLYYIIMYYSIYYIILYYGIMYHTIFHYNIIFVILYYIIHYDIIIDIVLYNALSSQSHKNKKIVWKHGPYNAFRSVMLRFHGWSLSKGVQSNKNGFRQERFSLRG